MVWFLFMIGAMVVTAAARIYFQRQAMANLSQAFAASANQTVRLAAAPVGPSPLPKARYDEERGDYSFLSVRALPLDIELRTIVRNFGGSGLERRNAVRQAMSEDDQYTILHFAKRCAVLAIREATAQWCEDGLNAMAMLDETTVDPRDAPGPAGLLGYAMGVTGAERTKLVDRAIALARPGMTEAIGTARKPTELHEWLYAEIKSDNGGFGLIGIDLGPYAPTFDMAKLALRIAAQRKNSRYVVEPKLAEDVPAVWFAKEHRPAAEALLKHARAGISVHGNLRGHPKFGPGAQGLFEWVVEMRTEREALDLCDYVGAGTPLEDSVSVGVAHGRLFALLVSRALFHGVAPLESRTTLASLAAETQKLLKEFSTSQPAD